MRKKAFQSLLNLYLDGEITPKDAAELERAITANPEFRRIYNEYCQLNKATRLVYERFRVAAATQGDASIRAFQHALHGSAVSHQGGVFRRLPWRSITIWGTSVAAACVMVFSGIAVIERSPEPPMISSRGVPIAHTPERTEKAFGGAFSVTVRADPYLPLVPANRLERLSVDVWSSGTSDSILPARISEFQPSNASLHETMSGTIEFPVFPHGANPDRPRNARVFRSGMGATPVYLEPVGVRIHR